MDNKIIDFLVAAIKELENLRNEFIRFSNLNDKSKILFNEKLRECEAYLLDLHDSICSEVSLLNDSFEEV